MGGKSEGVDMTRTRLGTGGGKSEGWNDSYKARNMWGKK